MAISTEFAAAIEQACTTQAIDYDSALSDIERLISTDSILAWAVWAGPGWSQENLALDVYAASRHTMYSYSIFSNGPVRSSASAVLLSSITNIGLVSVNDERSSRLLVIRSAEGEIGRVFGNEAYISKLEGFMRSVLGSIIEAKERSK